MHIYVPELSVLSTFYLFLLVSLKASNGQSLGLMLPPPPAMKFLHYRSFADKDPSLLFLVVVRWMFRLVFEETFIP